MNNKWAFILFTMYVGGFITANSHAADEPATTTAPLTAAIAADSSTTASASYRQEYTKEGADTCIKCHDEDSDYPVFDIFKTSHGMREDKRTPFANLQCETCHGPGAAGRVAMEETLATGGHVGKVRPGQQRPPIINFGAKSDEAVEEQNAMCLGCHQGNQHISWKGSTHESAKIACASCHRIHIQDDPVLSTQRQPDVCLKCHKKQSADFYKPSSHPVRAGLMTCTECHKPHGSAADKLLAKPTLNQTCYTCHAEKRGPFLWSHAPASEDCSLCHTPHGSVHPSLLVKSPPLLCQQCHSVTGHPAVARTGDALPGGASAPSAFLLAGGCTNCHSQVHGSNHPSGVKAMR